MESKSALPWQPINVTDGDVITTALPEKNYKKRGSEAVWRIDNLVPGTKYLVVSRGWLRGDGEHTADQITLSIVEIDDIVTWVESPTSGFIKLEVDPEELTGRYSYPGATIPASITRVGCMEKGYRR